ncbi:MAG: hypothetical protein HXK67_01240 [Clostridiales bacterium]|nr:hypothetical protein [Clostridiales bacterium]MBF0985802.1 hypothetical protein [Clostridiales bacterium]
MLVAFFVSVLKTVSEVSLIEIRNNWITALIALTAVSILLSTIGIKLSIVQTFLNSSLRAIAYIFKGIIRLIASFPRWISGLFKGIRGFLKSLGMSERLSNIIAIIIIIIII